MKRTFAALLAAGILLQAVATADAGWTDFWRRGRTDFRRVNSWPEPFKGANRMTVRRNLAAYTRRGWQLNNTLSNHMFDPATQQLTTAGMIKLRWVMTQAPIKRQQVFVLNGRTQEETTVRLESVKRAVAQLGGNRSQSVFLTKRQPWGGSGEYFQAVDAKFKDNINPKLPVRVGTTGAAGGGSSN